MNSKKRAVVSFANTPAYQEKMYRLKESLVGRTDADFIGFTSEAEVGAKPHSEVPYAFKPYAIQKAIDMGYESILWLDSPICATQNLEAVFSHIEQHGYLFFSNIGHPLGKWTDQKCLDYFRVTREQAMEMTQIMACAQGLNMADSIAREYFSKYLECASNGLFIGGWESFRHDQTCASHIVNDMDLTIVNGHESYFIYEHFKQVFQIADSVCLISK